MFAFRIAAVCLALAISVDTLIELFVFSGWFEVVRGWVTTTIVVAIVAYPIGCYIGATRLDHHRFKIKLNEQSLNDSLTGLRNRSALSIDFETTPPDNRRLLLVSVDRFKTVNQRFGHAAGDRILVRSARMIAEELANLGSIYRTDGTEFTLLFTTGTPAEIRAQVLTLLARFESTDFGTSEKPAHLTLSAGLADAPAGTGLAEAFAAADAALEAAKAAGRSQLSLGSAPRAAGIVEAEEIVWDTDKPQTPRRRKAAGA